MSSGTPRDVTRWQHVGKSNSRSCDISSWNGPTTVMPRRPASGRRTTLPGGDRRLRLADQLGDDLGRRLHRCHHANALAGHQTALLDIAVDHRPAQRAGPEMLALE